MVMASAQAAYTEYPEYRISEASPAYSPPSAIIEAAKREQFYQQGTPLSQKATSFQDRPAVRSPNSTDHSYMQENGTLAPPQYSTPEKASRTHEHRGDNACTEYSFSPYDARMTETGRRNGEKRGVGSVAVRHLQLSGEDQRHRIEGAPQQPGYCVDELCSCNQHQCLPVRKPLPFIHDSTYRTEYKNKGLPTREQRLASLLGPDGVPYGVDPKLWDQYVQKHGVPPLDNLPGCLFYKPSPDTRDFVTETRAQYKTKDLTPPQPRILYGPNGVPYGVNPDLWAQYLEKYGGPPKSGTLPAYLFYKPTQDTRDFGTECRTQYTAKKTSVPRDAGVFWGGDINTPPPNVDADMWRHYVEKYGLPKIGSILPAWLYHRSFPDTRDFATNYRKSYVPYTVDVCQVSRLPPYPIPSWPREHTFWDPVAKKWY